MATSDKPWNALRPDAQAFDEVRIVTVPRFKDSELSGSEWRIHADIQFYRKGVLVHQRGVSNTEHAAGFVYAEYQSAIDNGKAYFAGDDIHCDQEGCSNEKTVTYKMLKKACRDGHQTSTADDHRETRRHFCERHKKRGDSGLDDCDRNYELVLS